MSIKYLPKNHIKKILLVRDMKGLVKENLTVNKMVMRALSKSTEISKKSFETIALKVIKSYKKTYYRYLREGMDKEDALKYAINGKDLLVQRVKDAVNYTVKEEIKEKYYGEFYEWLPSGADEPDPEHQLKYGQTFQVGVGEMPGDRYGCQCGMNLLVDGKNLNL